MMDQFSVHYSDDSKKNAFNNGSNNRHGLKSVTCEQILKRTVREQLNLL